MTGRTFAKVLLVVLFGLFMFFMGRLTDHEQKQPPIKVVPVEIVKEVEKKVVVEKNTYPKACLDATAAAAKLRELVDKYEEQVGEHPGIIDRSYRALQMKDTAGLNQASTDHNKLKGETIQVLLDIRAATEAVDAANRACHTALSK